MSVFGVGEVIGSPAGLRTLAVGGVSVLREKRGSRLQFGRTLTFHSIIVRCIIRSC